MNRYSSNRAKITSDLKTMEDKLFKIEDNTLISWLMQLYDCSYGDAKDSIADARKEIEESRQAELSQDADKDKALDNIVNNLDEKLSSEEQEVKEMFTDGKEI